MNETPLSETMGVVISGASGEFGTLDHSLIEQRLWDNGAVLLRDFSLSIDEFECLTRRFTDNFLVHHGMGREFINQDGTTQTVAPGSAFIPAHIERGYAAPIPNTVFFYCVHPPTAGGETVVYDGGLLFDRLPDRLQAFFRDNKMRWKISVGPQIWQRTLNLTDQAEAMTLLEAQCGMLIDRDRGESVSAVFEGDQLLMDFVTPSTRYCKRRSKEVFANSGLSYLDSWRDDPALQLRLEDDSEFPLDQLEQVLQIAETIAVPLHWNAGDLIAIDNNSVLHGRRGFDDDNRKILIRIGF